MFHFKDNSSLHLEVPIFLTLMEMVIFYVVTFYVYLSHMQLYTKCKLKKVNVFHSLIAVGAVRIRVPLYLGHS